MTTRVVVSNHGPGRVHVHVYEPSGDGRGRDLAPQEAFEDYVYPGKRIEVLEDAPVYRKAEEPQS